MLRVAIHQPNYIPSLRYFAKIALCDVFVFLDNVQFSKGGYENRNKIVNNKQVEWLTVPVKKGLIKDLETIGNWRAKHAKTVYYNYKKHPDFSKINKIYCDSMQYEFAEMNIYYIENIARLLGIKTKFIRQSKMNVSGSKQTLLENICKDLKATKYVSGRNNYIQNFAYPIEWINYIAYPYELSSLHDLLT